MDHPETPESVDVPVSLDEDSAAAELDKLFASEDAGEDQDGEELETDDAELEEGEDEDEPETPAIEPPASLNAEEKARFAQLPDEAQQLILEVESRRNADVTKVTTRAAEAQRAAEAAAAQADASAKAEFAQRLDTFVAAFAPQRPDPMLAQMNPAQYIAEQAQYEAMTAQHNDLVQQVKAVKEEAQTEAQQAFVARRERDLMQIPEIANAETREAYLSSAFEVAELFGYDRSEIGQGAEARDIKAFALAAQWKADAEKYRRVMSKQMQKVRSGKGKNLRPNAAQREGSGKARAYSENLGKLRSTGSIEDAAAALSAMI